METLLAVDQNHGLELFNSGAEHENCKEDSSYVADQCLERMPASVGIRDRRLSLQSSTSTIAWTMVRAAQTFEEAVLTALRRGHTTPRAVRRCATSRWTLATRSRSAAVPARAVVMMSRYETRWAVRADIRSRQDSAKVLQARRARVRSAPGSSLRWRCPISASWSRTSRDAGHGQPDLVRTSRSRTGCRRCGRGDAVPGSVHQLPVELKDERTTVAGVDRNTRARPSTVRRSSRQFPDDAVSWARGGALARGSSQSAMEVIVPSTAEALRRRHPRCGPHQSRWRSTVRRWPGGGCRDRDALPPREGGGAWRGDRRLGVRHVGGLATVRSWRTRRWKVDRRRRTEALVRVAGLARAAQVEQHHGRCSWRGRSRPCSNTGRVAEVGLGRDPASSSRRLSGCIST